MSAPSTGDAELATLAGSTAYLAALVTPLDDATVQSRAYPAAWTIADVLSHLGSGAEIMLHRLTNGLAGEGIPDDFAPAVWDAWNAKTPQAQIDDALRVDRDLQDAFEAVAAEARAAIRFPFGPMEVGFAETVGFRLNEHVLHTWDVEVALDPAATLQPAAVPAVIDNLDVISRFGSRPTGSTRTIRVRTTDPERELTVRLEPESVSVTGGGDDGPADVRLPAEAWVRLVYGRLDPEHTPSGVDGDDDALAELRRAFPGV